MVLRRPYNAHGIWHLCLCLQNVCLLIGDRYSGACAMYRARREIARRGLRISAMSCSRALVVIADRWHRYQPPVALERDENRA